METTSPFQLGSKVTICSDKEGLCPKRTGVVKRIGIGAWRLGLCSEWYDFNGVRQAVDKERFRDYAKITCFARLYREGDEEAIRKEEKRLADLSACYYQRDKLQRKKRDEEKNIQSHQLNIKKDQQQIVKCQIYIGDCQKNIEQINLALDLLKLEESKLLDLSITTSTSGGL